MTLQALVSLAYNALMLNEGFVLIQIFFSSSSDLTPIEICTSKNMFFTVLFCFALFKRREGNLFVFTSSNLKSINGSWLPFWNPVVVLMDFFLV